MNKRLVAALATSLGPALAAGQTVSPPEELFLTVQPGGSAFAREVRSAQLVDGRNSIQAFETSPQIVPGSVHLRSLTHPADLTLREQSLWYEVLDEARLLELLVGQEVDLLIERTLESERVEGRLLLPPRASSPIGERRVPLFLETTEGDIRVVDGGELTLDTFPDGSWNRVRLDWALEAKSAGRHRLELCYRTEGLELELGYTLRLDEAAAQADLLGVASIGNDTGHTFVDARVQVSVPSAAPRAHWDRDGGPDRPSYPIRDPVRLEARRTTELALVHVVGVPVTRAYSVFPESHPAGRPDRAGRVPVVQRFDLRTRTEAGFPAALPPGPVQVYRLSADRGLHHEGESQLPATVRGEILSFSGRPLPGVVVERRVSVAQNEAGRSRSVDLRFHNERAEEIRVEVLEPLGVREVARSDASRVELSRPGWALIHVDVPSLSSASAEYRVVVE